MTGHGGRRPGAGGPPKPPLTRAELTRAVERCIDLNAGRVTDRGITDAINEERTRGYLDPRSRAKHSVSSWWVRQQRKMLRLSNIDQKPALERLYPTRFPERDENRTDIEGGHFAAQKAEAKQPHSPEVDSAGRSA